MCVCGMCLCVCVCCGGCETKQFIKMRVQNIFMINDCKRAREATARDQQRPRETRDINVLLLTTHAHVTPHTPQHTHTHTRAQILTGNHAHTWRRVSARNFGVDVDIDAISGRRNRDMTTQQCQQQQQQQRKQQQQQLCFVLTSSVATCVTHTQTDIDIHTRWGIRRKYVLKHLQPQIS